VAARQLLAASLPPENIWWVEDERGSQQAENPKPRSHKTAAEFNVPREFVQLAKFAACHHSADRWSLLYQVLWRLTHGEPHLLALSGDTVVARLNRYDKAVHRDLHKMKAFVRFKKLQDTKDERFVAWFEPEHYIFELAADFFIRRFTNMRWSVLTPVGCAHWEGKGKPEFTPGLNQAFKPSDDLEALWKTYYKNIFNPARVKLKAMCAEMPQKYWRHLPEAEEIPALVLSANQRLGNMLASEPASSSLHCGERPASYQALLADVLTSQETAPLSRIAAGVRSCQNCELCKFATQAVSGEGPQGARIMLVGEQPGDQEDLAGRPFVGPAGTLLDDILAELSLSRDQIYLTNAVKHFRFKPTPKRRLHERPKDGHVNACRDWLEQEIAAVDPQVIVCLGVTAATSVLGRKVTLREVAGQVMSVNHRTVIATLHPAAVLRAADPLTARQRLSVDLASLRSLISPTR